MMRGRGHNAATCCPGGDIWGLTAGLHCGLHIARRVVQRDEHQQGAQPQADGNGNREGLIGSDGALQCLVRRTVPGRAGKLTLELLQCSENLISARIAMAMTDMSSLL